MQKCSALRAPGERLKPSCHGSAPVARQVAACRAFVCSRGRNCGRRFLDLPRGESYDRSLTSAKLLRESKADKEHMKRFIAITAVVVVGFAALASAQSSATKPLADVAKAEEARRKSVRKPAKVYTNGSLRTDVSPGVPAPPTVAQRHRSAREREPDEHQSRYGGAACANRRRQGPGLLVRPDEGGARHARSPADFRGLAAEPHQRADDRLRQSRRSGAAREDRDRSKTALAELERVKKELDEQTQGDRRTSKMRRAAPACRPAGCVPARERPLDSPRRRQGLAARDAQARARVAGPPRHRGARRA